MNRPNYCGGCEDRNGPDCALPTATSKLGRFGLKVLGETVDSFIQLSALSSGRRIDPDSLGVIAHSERRIEELYVPAEACSYLHQTEQ